MENNNDWADKLAKKMLNKAKTKFNFKNHEEVDTDGLVSFLADEFLKNFRIKQKFDLKTDIITYKVKKYSGLILLFPNKKNNYHSCQYVREILSNFLEEKNSGDYIVDIEYLIENGKIFNYNILMKE
ncbi:MULTISPECIES: hypothetical protein [Weeksellaceae]|uniref:hypothetical protein n=1 Tax=Weeksellaceae TaxID=2762318 RepID=UPI0021F8862D|nr:MULTISPECIES: hypothetical protein [Weeksellaceae]MCW0518312.1 hypothetical protein [Riemerella anatipestifer]MEC5393944.1 hypothetical protein [Bergeyella sp. RCAD1439]